MAQLELMKAEIECTEAQLTYIAAEKATGVWKPAKFLAAHPVVPFSARRGEDRDYSLRAVSPDWNRCTQHRAPGDTGGRARRKVSYIYRGDSQTDRAPFDQVLETVRKISA